MINRQAVFTKVATHLLKQNAKSQDDEGCLYRGPGGTMCAIGCLIDDEHYSEHFNREGLADFSVRNALAQSLGCVLGERDMPLLRKLQKLHDNQSPEAWADSLRELADGHGLQMPGAP